MLSLLPSPAADLLALHLALTQLSFVMPTEISDIDAEDLKSRVRELRRFL
jgi:hypothetical protein